MLKCNLSCRIYDNGIKFNHRANGEKVQVRWQSPSAFDKEYRRRRFRGDHIYRLTYWSDGVLPRDKLGSLPWPLAELRV